VGGSSSQISLLTFIVTAALVLLGWPERLVTPLAPTFPITPSLRAALLVGQLAIDEHNLASITGY